MAIYVFSLLTGYFFGGLEYAQGMRYKYLKKLSSPVKYVFTYLPTEGEIQRYHQVGIGIEDMMSAHYFMCGKKFFNSDTHISNISYFSNQHKVVQEYQVDELIYTDFYSYDRETNTSHLSKKTFRYPNGTIAYDIIFDKNGAERYLFPNGENCSKQEFLCKFITGLNLTQQDIVLVDRTGQSEFIQPLLTCGCKAKIVVFFHSRHYVEEGEAPEFLYLNPAYYCWINNSQLVNTIIVSTDAQKQDIIRLMQSYSCHVPNVEVIPASGISTLLYPDEPRKPFSLLTVSRLTATKKIDLAIKSVIAAHKINPQITLDIYGEGSPEYTSFLKKIVEDHQASSYIRFMGHCDMTNRYQQYEAYLSTSLGESLGLTLMEATGSGTAMIGFNAKYGNDIFIQNDINGYSSPIDFTQLNNTKYISYFTEKMAENIIRLFQNKEKLHQFQTSSYQIAKNYLEDIISEKWITFFEHLLIH